MQRDAAFQIRLKLIRAQILPYGFLRVFFRSLAIGWTRPITFGSVTPLRRHHKFLKKPEGGAVWPENVERAFLLGLRLYRWELTGSVTVDTPFDDECLAHDSSLRSSADSAPTPLMCTSSPDPAPVPNPAPQRP
ncbi:hypothetical protein B0H14DRAFT_3445261 [Mycena olivaceomarginata]|nr:hypothetical protein B0H14DRAFT_3445261 [Mycena olivaceomarginata]